MHKLFVDINVIIDVAVQRDPHHESSKKVLSLIESRKCSGCICAASFQVIYYLIRKQLNQKNAITYLKDLMRLFLVVALDRSVLERALDMDAPDFEDAIQMACAEKTGANYIITRNTADYQNSPVAALTPSEYLATFQAG